MNARTLARDNLQKRCGEPDNASHMTRRCLAPVPMHVTVLSVMEYQAHPRLQAALQATKILIFSSEAAIQDLSSACSLLYDSIQSMPLATPRQHYILVGRAHWPSIPCCYCITCGWTVTTPRRSISMCQAFGQHSIRAIIKLPFYISFTAGII